MSLPDMLYAQTILLFPVGFFLLYLAFLSMCALWAHERKEFTAERLRRFAIIVPAHDEELGIGATLASLLGVEYPRDKFDVIVVADNCSDRTAAIAKTMGAVVYERFDREHQGKGYALRWIFDKLQQSNTTYEAFVVIDADSAASRNFLQVMNFYLEKGAVSLQCTDIVQPVPNAWNPQMTEISYILVNLVRPLGRRVLGLPCGLKGNGMCLANEIMRRFSWNTFSLAEDAEYGLSLLCDGIRTFFAREAKVFATMPQDPRNAVSQRSRWEKGRIPLILRYCARLLRLSVQYRSAVFFDAWVDLVTPSLVNMAVVTLLMIVLNGILLLLGMTDAAFFLYSWLIAGAIAGLHLFVGLWVAHADRSLYLALINVPRYAIWKLGVYMHVLHDKQNDHWVRTTREASDK